MTRTIGRLSTAEMPARQPNVSFDSHWVTLDGVSYRHSCIMTKTVFAQSQTDKRWTKTGKSSSTDENDQRKGQATLDFF